MEIKMNELQNKTLNEVLLEIAKSKPNYCATRVEHTYSEMLKYILGDVSDKFNRIAAIHLFGLAQLLFLEEDGTESVLITILGGVIRDGDMMQRFFNVTEYMAGRESSIYGLVDREFSESLREVRLNK